MAWLFLSRVLAFVELALTQDLTNVGHVSHVGVMQRVVVFEVLSKPILNNPVLEDPHGALFLVADEDEVGHFPDELGLLAADGRRQNGLLLERLDEGAPLQKHDHVA